MLPDFQEIYEAEVSHVWKLLRRFGVPEADLEDRTHDVFLVAFRRLQDYDPSRPVRLWLAGISVRIAAQHHRQSRHKREILKEEAEAVDPRPGAESLLATKERRDLVLQALQSLDQDRRMVFVLHEIEDFSVPEIATLLDVPINTLYSRLRLGRDQFSASLKRLTLKRGEV